MSSTAVRFDLPNHPLSWSDAQSRRFNEIIIKISSIDPYERNRQYLQMRAFLTWSRCAVLIRKCDELKRQLQERSAVFKCISDSYNRDVISVKHHLTSVTDLVKQHLEYDLYDITSMPTLEIEAVIKRAERCPSETSEQLKETLMNAGLIDKKSGLVLNPWECGKAYLSYQKRRHGEDQEFAFPRTREMHSIRLCKPDSHRVMIQYCDECVGMMHLVREWNESVEGALNMHYNYAVVEKKFEKLHDQIEYLKGVIKEQEQDLDEVRMRNRQLENGKEWLDEFTNSHGLLGNTKSHIENDEKLSEEVAKWRNRAEMAAADRESTEYNNNLRWEEEMLRAKDREVEKLEEIKDWKDRVQREEDVKFMMTRRIHEQDNRYKELEGVLQGQKDENIQLIEDINRLKQQIAAMTEKEQRIVKDYDERFDLLKVNEKKQITTIASLETTVEGMQLEIDTLLAEAKKNEEKMESYRAEMRRMREAEAMHDQSLADAAAEAAKRYDELNTEYTTVLQKLEQAERQITAFQEAEKARMKAEEERRLAEYKLKMESRSSTGKKSKKSAKSPKVSTKSEPEKEPESEIILSEAPVSILFPIKKEGMTFRIAGIMVRCLVRLLKAFRTYDFKNLGTLGLKMELRRAHKLLSSEEGDLKHIHATAKKQEKLIEKQRYERLELKRQLRRQRLVSNRMAATVFHLRAITTALNVDTLLPKPAVLNHNTAMAALRVDSEEAQRHAEIEEQRRLEKQARIARNSATRLEYSNTEETDDSDKSRDEEDEDGEESKENEEGEEVDNGNSDNDSKSQKQVEEGEDEIEQGKGEEKKENNDHHDNDNRDTTKTTAGGDVDQQAGGAGVDRVDTPIEGSSVNPGDAREKEEAEGEEEKREKRQNGVRMEAAAGRSVLGNANRNHNQIQLVRHKSYEREKDLAKQYASMIRGHDPATGTVVNANATIIDDEDEENGGADGSGNGNGNGNNRRASASAAGGAGASATTAVDEVIAKRTRIQALMARWRHVCRKIISESRLSSAAVIDILDEAEGIDAAYAKVIKPFPALSSELIVNDEGKLTGKHAHLDPYVSDICEKISSFAVEDMRKMESLVCNLREVVFQEHARVRELRSEMKKLRDESQGQGEMFQKGRSLLLDTIEQLKIEIADKEKKIALLLERIDEAKAAEKSVLDRLNTVREQFEDVRGKLVKTASTLEVETIEKHKLMKEKSDLEERLVEVANQFASDYAKMAEKLKVLTVLEEKLVKAKETEEQLLVTIRELNSMRDESAQWKKKYHETEELYRCLLITNDTLRKAIADGYRTHIEELERALHEQADAMAARRKREELGTLLLRIENREVYIRDSGYKSATPGQAVTDTAPTTSVPTAFGAGTGTGTGAGPLSSVNHHTSATAPAITSNLFAESADVYHSSQSKPVGKQRPMTAAPAGRRSGPDIGYGSGSGLASDALLSNSASFSMPWSVDSTSQSVLSSTGVRAGAGAGVGRATIDGECTPLDLGSFHIANDTDNISKRFGLPNGQVEVQGQYQVRSQTIMTDSSDHIDESGSKPVPAKIMLRPFSAAAVSPSRQRSTQVIRQSRGSSPSPPRYYSNTSVLIDRQPKWNYNSGQSNGHSHSPQATANSNTNTNSVVKLALSDEEAAHMLVQQHDQDIVAQYASSRQSHGGIGASAGTGPGTGAGEGVKWVNTRAGIPAGEVGTNRTYNQTKFGAIRNIPVSSQANNTIYSNNSNYNGINTATNGATVISKTMSRPVSSTGPQHRPYGSDMGREVVRATSAPSDRSQSQKGSANAPYYTSTSYGTSGYGHVTDKEKPATTRPSSAVPMAMAVATAASRGSTLNLPDKDPAHVLPLPAAKIQQEVLQYVRQQKQQVQQQRRQQQEQLYQVSSSGKIDANAPHRNALLK